MGSDGGDGDGGSGNGGGGGGAGGGGAAANKAAAVVVSLRLNWHGSKMKRPSESGYWH